MSNDKVVATYIGVGALYSRWHWEAGGDYTDEPVEDVLARVRKENPGYQVCIALVKEPA
jgi:hypothetical protein